MRIVISSDIYPPVISGVSTVVDKQSRMLASRGHNVVVIAPGYPPYTLIPITKNLTHYSILALPNMLRDNSYTGYVPVFHVRTMLTEFRPDLIHFHSIGPVGYSTLRAANQLHIPTIGTMHGIPQFITAYAPWLTKTSKRVTHSILWWFVRNFYNRMDHITTPSKFAAAQMLDHGITTPISVIPMWIDTTHNQNTSKQIIKKYSLPTNKHLFLYVGRIDLDKNLPVILYGIKKLLRTTKKFHIIFAGKGSHLPKLQKLADTLLISSVITWTGYIEEYDKFNLYNLADTFIMPSPVETQSLTTLEALQAKLPLILANAGALPEIAQLYPERCSLFEYNDPKALSNIMNIHIHTKPQKRIPKIFNSVYGKDEHIQKIETLYTLLLHI